MADSSRNASNLRVFGADFSVYVRIVRLVLEEKKLDYELVPVDVFDPAGVPAELMSRHPFGKMPAFEHGSVGVIETTAICRYIDEAFPSPPLQPASLADRALVNQIISMLDAYAYRTLVWDIFVERRVNPIEDLPTDEKRIAAALPAAATFLSAFERFARLSPWIVGDQLTLADLHAAPIFAKFLATPEGKALIADRPRIATWFDKMTSRVSFEATRGRRSAEHNLYS